MKCQGSHVQIEQREQYRGPVNSEQAKSNTNDDRLAFPSLKTTLCIGAHATIKYFIQISMIIDFRNCMWLDLVIIIRGVLSALNATSFSSQLSVGTLSARGPSLYVVRRQILTYKDGLRAERVNNDNIIIDSIKTASLHHSGWRLNNYFIRSWGL